MKEEIMKIPTMLMIGGATRNVGKTTLTQKIIEKFATKNLIIGLKIKTLYKGDTFFHGKDRFPLHENENYRITEDVELNSGQDTSKMLIAGAKRVFRIKVKNDFIDQAIAHLFKKIDSSALLICESNSLRTVVKPGVFLMIKHTDGREMKPSAKKLEAFADKIIYTNGESHDFSIELLSVYKNKWKLEEKISKK